MKPALMPRPRHWLWALNARLGRRISLGIPQKATVLITYYSPVRAQSAENQIRSILQCDFVERLVVSSHNPGLQMDRVVTVRDPRLVFRCEEVRRGCGHRWAVAAAFNPDYLVVIDDDILLYPHQLGRLFSQLVKEPGIPHGLSGMLWLEGGGFEFRENEDRSVDYLCEVYAVTGRHLRRFAELRAAVAHLDRLAPMIESAADFVVISSTGDDSPHIHRAGRLVRCPTFKQAGIAVHKESGFEDMSLEVARALRSIAAPTGKTC